MPRKPATQPYSQINSIMGFRSGTPDIQVQQCKHIPGYAGHQPRMEPTTKVVWERPQSREQGDSKWGSSPVRASVLENSLRHKSQERTVPENFVRRALSQAGNAVVSIDTKSNVEHHVRDVDIFSFFFGGVPAPDGERRVHTQVVQARGSGFCVDPTGIVLTNAHVVSDVDSITVTFPSGEQYQARVVAKDPLVDLAVLQLRSSSSVKLPVVRLGSSKSVRVGDWAIAVGNPLGLDSTVTLGIISNLERSTGEAGWDWASHKFIQTDAAINQGNSGGPLLDENGKCVGMITARAQFAEAIGFAVPIDTIRSSLPTLLEGKQTPHAYLGLRMKTGSKELAGKYNGSSPQGTAGDFKGVLVEGVMNCSPAAAAGVRKGDIITSIRAANHPEIRVTRIEDVQKVVQTMHPRDRATVFIRRRRGERQTVAITAGDSQDIRNVSL